MKDNRESRRNDDQRPELQRKVFMKEVPKSSHITLGTHTTGIFDMSVLGPFVCVTGISIVSNDHGNETKIGRGLLGN